VGGGGRSGLSAAGCWGRSAVGFGGVAVSRCA
jgi:hypothetical protein